MLPGPFCPTRNGLREAVEDGHRAAPLLQHGLEGLEGRGNMVSHVFTVSKDFSETF